MLHYTFDNDNGARVLDDSGNGNVGSAVGEAVWSAAGMRGGCYRFGTEDGYIDAGTGRILQKQDMLSVSAWIKADTLYGNVGNVAANNNSCTIATRSDGEGRNSWLLQLYKAEPHFVMGAEVHAPLNRRIVDLYEAHVVLPGIRNKVSPEGRLEFHVILRRGIQRGCTPMLRRAKLEEAADGRVPDLPDLVLRTILDPKLDFE